jgi:hypothetical protein
MMLARLSVSAMSKGLLLATDDEKQRAARDGRPFSRRGTFALRPRITPSAGPPGPTDVIHGLSAAVGRSRRVSLLTIALTAVSLGSGAYAQNATAVQVSSDCGPVSDTVFVSPDGTKAAHLMNQYCSYGVAANNNPFWIVLGNDVAKAGGEDHVDQFGPEDHVVFKTDTFAPVVSWTSENSLVVTIEEIVSIYKSAHSLDGIRIKYKISEKLSREKYLGDLQGTEPPWAFELDLKYYEIFQKWARENAE